MPNRLNVTCKVLAKPPDKRLCRRRQTSEAESGVCNDATAYVRAEDIPTLLLDMAIRSGDAEPLTFAFPDCPERAHVSECEFIFTFSHLPYRRNALVSWFWRWGISFRVDMR